MNNSKINANLFWKQFMNKNRINLIVGSILSILSAVCNIAIAFLLQGLIDVAASGNSSNLLPVLYFGGGILIFYVLIELMKRFFIHKLFYRGLVTYKTFIFDRILSKNINMFNKNSTGKYISALSNDVSAIESNYLENIFEMILSIAHLIGGLVAMAYYNLILFASIITASMLPILVSIFMKGKLERCDLTISKENEIYISNLRDMMSGFSVIKSFRAESEMKTIFTKKNEALEVAKRNRRNKESDIKIISAVSKDVLLLVVFTVGAVLSINGSITPGTVVACIQLLNYISSPIQILPAAIGEIHAAHALVEKIKNELEETDNENGSRSISDFETAIEFKDVSFSYEEGKDVIRHINLHFDKGKSYGIVGVSGSGKSTLLNLLLGYYKTYKGEILFDSIDIKNIQTESLYQLLSVIQQEVYIFDDNIYANITMHKQFSSESIDNAIRHAGLQSFVQEKGIDYSCGECGSNLSGGERQRISIARTLLKGTPVILMDEATASLDNLTALEVESAILQLEGLTKIIVTHRLNEDLLKKLDTIFVLKNGLLVESGSFDDLLKQKSYFSSLYSVESANELYESENTTSK